MTELQREYQRLEYELQVARDLGDYDEEKEDSILTEMEEVWWQMDEEEREIF